VIVPARCQRAVIGIVAASGGGELPHWTVDVLGALTLVPAALCLPLALNIRGVATRQAATNRAKREKRQRYGVTSALGLRLLGVWGALVFGGVGLLLLVS
jgi:hypothetical protein